MCRVLFASLAYGTVLVVVLHGYIAVAWVKSLVDFPLLDGFLIHECALAVCLSVLKSLFASHPPSMVTANISVFMHNENDRELGRFPPNQFPSSSPISVGNCGQTFHLT